MSTPQVTPQPQQTNQQPQQAVPQPQQAPLQPQMAEWTAADGKVYKDTPDKIAEIAGTRYNELYGEYDKIKREAQEAREQLEVIRQQATTGHEQPKGDGQFDQPKYWQMMNTNPVEAQRYLNNFIPEYKTVQGAVTQVSGMRQVHEADLFKASNPDFEVNEANTEKLARICTELYGNSDVVNSRQMSAAYSLMKEAAPTATPQNVPPPPPKPSASQSTGAPDINKMDQAKLAAYIRDLESKGAR